MKTASVLFLLVVGASAAEVTPVQKVIQMLSDMGAKGKKEMQEEQVRFAAFAQFCEGAEADKVQRVEASKETIGELNGEIEGLELEIDQLSADIQKADADIGALGQKIAALDEAMKEIGGQEEEVTEERKEEHALFEKKDTDLGESVNALDRAVAEMKTQDVAHAQASLLEVMSKKYVPEKAKRVIGSFLQRDPEVLLQSRLGAPEADSYEFQSEGVIQMFDDLEHKMADERSDGQKGEMNKKHSYDMLMQELVNRMDRTKDERERDTAEKAAKTQALADAQGEKADTENTLAEDEKYLAELRQMCKTKTDEFEARQELRQGEQDAIGKAVEILSGGSVSGAADKHLPGFVQQGTSLAQLKGAAVSPLQSRVAAFLKSRASKVNSPILALVATRMGDDPFTKVKKMIKDMVTKLMEEANEEAEHKGWCDTELSTNQQTREAKSDEVDKLSAQIEALTATVSKLSEDITELSEGIATIDKAVAEATADRQAEKAKNVETIADAKAASTAVSQAVAVLKEFYAKAAEATALVQAKGPAEDAPETFSGAYQGNQDQAGGVMGMLEVIQSDFARLESQTTAGEAEASDVFQKYSADSATNKAVKDTDVKHKTSKKQETESALQDAKKDLASTHEELSAAMDYYDKLKPSCVDAGVSYEDRVARRKEEIESLQEALKILSGEDIAV
jgi:septal ring factor EnvC (AmiA/AmiB activator)